MGRSTSCFKIIACGGDSDDSDDLNVSESKGSNDKRGWSFRKRSARHRILSNNVISETTSSVKESQGSADLNYQPPNIFNIPEKISNVPENTSDVVVKISTVQCSDEKPQLSTTSELTESKAIADTNVEIKDDSAIDESVVIVIQTAVRGFVAQRELLKLKSLIKLQAAVRGHLVRRRAVGTLRCVQAIVKMQALVRARRARHEKEIDGKDENDHQDSINQGKQSSVTKPIAKQSSIQNLLCNRFARQLMESTPRNKPIHIKCDPAKQDSAWSWLERWMSVSVIRHTLEPESKMEQSENEKNRNFAFQVETRVSSEDLCDSVDSKAIVKETVLESESEQNLITYDTYKSNFEQSQLTSMSKDDPELCQPDKTTTSNVNEISVDIDSHADINSHQNLIMQTKASSEQSCKPLPNNPETEIEQPRRSMKRFASENLDTEGKKFVFGSRKLSNPAFTAAQSKFEELSSSANSGRSINSHHQDVSADSNTILSGADTSTRTKDLNTAENSVSRIQYGGSECGTELSISSTLDSPDGSEVGNVEVEHKVKVLEKETCDPINSNNPGVQVDDACGLATFDVSHPVGDQQEKVYDAQGESVNSVAAMDALQQGRKPESDASDFYKECDSETGHQPFRSSPEASPRSHVIIPESQETPSSQASVKAKINSTDKSGSNRKRKPLLASKGSPSNSNHDSGARSSMEQLPRDQKIGKRRNSFGSSKTENIDQETGDNSSSSSLPHFMQATESARAKFHANNSPRSSPDVEDGDIYTKKRHSLPVANGRQGSPRIQRSISQAQQGAKGNSTQPLHERKWQR